MGHNRSGSPLAGQCRHGGAYHIGPAGRLAPKFLQVGFQLNQAPHRRQRIAKQESGSFHGAEQVGDHGKLAPLHVFVQHRGPLGRAHPTMNFRRLQIGIHFIGQSHQMSGPMQVVNALPERPVTHEAKGEKGGTKTWKK